MRGQCNGFPHPLLIHTASHILNTLLDFHSLGQEPPPQPVEDVFDGRSLAEVRLVLIHIHCAALGASY